MTLRRITLTRIETSDHGTFGTFSIPNGDYLEFLYSGELPWRENQSGKSCIPTGVYQVSKAVWIGKNKLVFMLKNVPKRQGILVHAANFMGDREKHLKSQLYGCIALGEKLGTMDGQRSLLVSAPAIRRFQAMLEWEDFELEIK